MTVIHTAYFDRKDDSIYGVFTLQYYDPVARKVTKVFERLPASSGQTRWLRTNWTTGKSPTPYGAHWMATSPVPLLMTPRGTDFFPIGTTQANIGVIQGPKGQRRTEVGLHMENEYPGTAGCTALLVNSPERRKKVLELFDYLKHLDEPFIGYVVL